VEVSVPDPSPEQLDALLALQAIDLARIRLRHQLDGLVEQQQLDEVTARLAGLQRDLDDVRLDRDQALDEQRRLERETDVLTQRRDAERVRLYDGTVTNPREMRSVDAEIEATVRRIEEHEELLLDALERSETLDAQVGELEAAIAEAEAQVDERTRARDDAAKAILAELAEVDVRRDAQAEQVPDDLLARYDQAAERGGGVGIARLDGQSCTACRVELSMADVNGLLSGPSLTTCPQCRRLLVIAD
jgi:uncharacterized protein